MPLRQAHVFRSLSFGALLLAYIHPAYAQSPTPPSNPGASPATPQKNTLKGINEKSTPAEVLAWWINDSTKKSFYADKRINCGNAGVFDVLAGTKKDGVPTPEAADYCSALREHSAKVELTPALKKAKPNQDILEPYRQSAKVMNLPTTDEVAEIFLGFLNQGATDYAKSDAVIPINLNNKEGKSVGNLRLSPATAMEAGFSQVIRNVAKGKAAPKPLFEMEELKPYIKECTNDKGISNGDCKGVGEQHAANFIHQMAN